MKRNCGGGWQYHHYLIYSNKALIWSCRASEERFSWDLLRLSDTRWYMTSICCDMASIWPSRAAQQLDFREIGSAGQRCARIRQGCTMFDIIYISIRPHLYILCTQLIIDTCITRPQWIKQGCTMCHPPLPLSVSLAPATAPRTAHACVRVCLLSRVYVYVYVYVYVNVCAYMYM